MHRLPVWNTESSPKAGALSSPTQIPLVATAVIPTFHVSDEKTATLTTTQHGSFLAPLCHLAQKSCSHLLELNL